MEWKQQYERWQSFDQLEEDLKQQLNRISGNEVVLEDHFYKYLEFGTGGMRGELGPGTNRMNTYTIRRAAEGLARYIEEKGKEAKERGVVIAFDSRYRSPEFAMETALTLGAHDIKAYVFEELRPTPELSYAVRKLNASAGVVITASHNPPEYNGFKVYGEDGGQFPPGPAKELIEKVNTVEDELRIEVSTEETMKSKQMLIEIGEDIDHQYNTDLQTIVVNDSLTKEKGKDVTIVFTPLHGTAHGPVTRVLEKSGFSNVHVVREQALPDPEFSTVKSPNPEEQAAFKYAVRKGNEVGADVLIATDPDADRVGLAVKDHTGQYRVLTGNQTGALLLEYLLSQKKEKGVLPENGIVLKTIVTSELGRAIASHYGLTTVDTLTGFKFIGEKIKQYEQQQNYEFQFGYEESYGYLIGDFVRDKDAVQASLLASELVLWYKERNKTLYDGLLSIYNKYGVYLEDLEALTLKGKQGMEQISSIIREFRDNPPKHINERKVTVIEDYLTGVREWTNSKEKETIDLPSSNVIKYFLDDESWFCVRPSGTEPKIKFYFGVKQTSMEQAEEQIEKVKEEVMSRVKSVSS